MGSRERMIPVRVETTAAPAAPVCNNIPPPSTPPVISKHHVQQGQAQQQPANQNQGQLLQSTNQNEGQQQQQQPTNQNQTQQKVQQHQQQSQTTPQQQSGGAPWGSTGGGGGGAQQPLTNSASATIVIGGGQQGQQIQQGQQQKQTAPGSGRRLSSQSGGDEIGDKIIGMLDEIEKRVENLRETASLMEQEKESLIEMLNTVQINKDLLHIPQSDKEEIEATTNRLLSRCRTVNVSVSTPRNAEQERALSIVNDQIDDLMNKMREDVEASKQVCKKYLNACNPEQPDGPIDQRFQAMVIECTADDQKKIRRRLEHLLQMIDRADRTISSSSISQQAS